jgi:hypothetical protein
VWVGYDDAGALVFSGLDREYLDGYEDAVTVAPDQFDAMRRVLGAKPGPTSSNWSAPTSTRSWRAASGPGWTTMA